MKPMRLIAALLCLCAPALWAQASSGTPAPTARDFARFPTYRAVQLSPDGRHLAVSAQFGKESGLLVLSVADNKVVWGTRFRDDLVVGDLYWASDRRLLISPAYQEGAADTPRPTGELFAINMDGSDPQYLFGFRGAGTRLGSHIRTGPEREQGFASITDPLIEVPDEALVTLETNTVMTANGRYYDRSFAPLYRLNLRSGRRSLVARPPMRTPHRYFADAQGRAFLVSGVGDDSYLLKTFWRPGDGEWQALPFKARVLNPVHLARDGTRAYFDAEYDGGRECLLEWPVPPTVTATPTPPKEILCRPSAFLGQVYFTADDRPYGYNGGDDIGAVVFDLKATEAQALASLQEQFKGQFVYPLGATRKHEKLIFRVYSDRNSGEYYLFDAATRKASFFDADQTWIDPDRMASVTRIEYAARDGLKIHGYLTLPPGKPARNLPMVVIPHGGPIGVRDTWGWNADAQYLASRGYAVLQMNFRGSGGYGDAFEKKGFGEWGGKLIDDITDGTRWAVSQGIADGGRLCIFGASYGGFAALMSAVREPEMYRCAVGYAGVYDLNLLMTDSDVMTRNAGKLFWQDSVGKTPQELARQSPVSHVAHLKAAVMIVHGDEDIRAPVTQAKSLRKALEASGKPYEWMIKSGEGHGFLNEDNRTELYEKLAAFLDRHIGTAAIRP